MVADLPAAAGRPSAIPALQQKSVPSGALFVFNPRMNFEQTLESSPFFLMEAAIVERLRRAHPERLHPRLAIAPLVHSADGRALLTPLYQEYIAIARAAELPLILSTPTWRADKDRCREARIAADLNAEAAAFMQGFKQDYASLQVAGQIGCRNDCYRPEEALSPAEAYEFHAWQIERLTGADLLYAVTLPAAGEALGMARAMAETDRPYLISFVIGKDGRILDGTPLAQAIERIDSGTRRPPVGYGVNCCYPAFLQAADLSNHAADRMLSVQANASSLTHAELEAADTVEAEPVEEWAGGMLALHRILGLKILGGCCGTSAEHLRSLTA